MNISTVVRKRLRKPRLPVDEDEMKRAAAHFARAGGYARAAALSPAERRGNSEEGE